MKELLDKYKAGLDIQQRILKYLEAKAKDIEKVDAMIAKASLPKTTEDQKQVIRCLYIKWISTVKMDHFRSILVDVNVKLSQLEYQMNQLKNA